MWSKNKTVNITVDILLFLLAINVFHYGQFILPIICLILFIDNKAKFKVNSIFIFVILCLFAISFCLFSYKLGFYCVMGFCLPMAYYIGSNIKEVNEKNIIKLIYIIAFGMAAHVILDFIYEFSIEGIGYINSYTHYDFWLRGKIKETLTAVFFMPIIGCIYYLVMHEKKKAYKLTGILLLLLMFVYNIGLGRRTPVLMLVISIVVSLFLDFVVFKDGPINVKLLMKLLLAVFIPIVLVVVLYLTNLFNLRDWLSHLKVVDKFLWMGLKSERLELFIKAVKVAPEYLWGGQNISNSIGIYVHDLWMDTYDYAGIIPYLILVIWFINSIITMIKLYKNINVTYKSKILFITLFVVVSIQLHLDPIMSGSSLFLLTTIIIFGAFESLNKNHGKIENK